MRMKKRTRKKAAAQARRKAMRIERLMVTIPGWMAEKDAERLMARLEVWRRHGGAISLPKGVHVIAWDSKGRQIVMGRCEQDGDAQAEALAPCIQELKGSMDELKGRVDELRGHLYDLLRMFTQRSVSMTAEASRVLRNLRNTTIWMNSWAICLCSIAVGLMVRLLRR